MEKEMEINKAVVRERYDKYGEDFERHVRSMGGEYDWIVKKYLERYIRPNTLLLDVAGGDGLSTSLLDPDKVSIVSTDISVRLLDVARSRRRNHVLGILQDFDCPFPFLDEVFDYVVCVSALEFCRDLRFTLAEMLRVLKNGGMMLFSTDKYDEGSSLQGKYIYVHDERGFFSRRYSASWVRKLIADLGGRLLASDTHNAYRLKGGWIRYDYYLISK
ncbi:MAG: class I SAM-dependent methyltransferase [Proteobacteria bacterium]|nr:class I SAM-dependent methyltransferase [Pseudomonadota bacterium]